MKKIIFILFMLTTLPAYSLYAQRYEKSGNISFDIGALNNGISLNAGFEQLISLNSGFRTSFNFLNRKARLNNPEKYRPSLRDYLLKEEYHYYFLFNRFMPYLSAEAFGGYEDFYNKDKKPESVIIQRSSGWIYGVGISVGLEYNIKNYSFFGEISPKYELRHKEFILNLINLGIKYYL